MTMAGDRDRVRKLLVVSPNWLGDAVMSLPALALARDRSRTVMAVVSSPYTARVFWGAEGVDEVWVDRGRGRAARLFGRARVARAYEADAAVVLPPSFSSALAPFLAGVRVRVGFPTDGRAGLLSARTHGGGRDVHLSRSYAHLVRRALGESVPGNEAVLELRAALLRVSDAERSSARRMLETRGVRGAYVVVVPGAAFGPAKAWPWERYRELCAALARRGPVVLCGSQGDAAVCERVGAGVDGVVSVAGGTALGEFFALVEGARAVVANDSGAPHVAAALGIPVVALFGSTSPAWTAPLGPSARVLQHKVHCNPCFRRACPTQLECFMGIEVGAVLAQVEHAWDDNSHRSLARDSAKMTAGPGARWET